MRARVLSCLVTQLPGAVGLHCQPLWPGFTRILSYMPPSAGFLLCMQSECRSEVIVPPLGLLHSQASTCSLSRVPCPICEFPVLRPIHTQDPRRACQSQPPRSSPHPLSPLVSTTFEFSASENTEDTLMQWKLIELCQHGTDLEIFTNHFVTYTFLS